jgi:hypothetical protein
VVTIAVPRRRSVDRHHPVRQSYRPPSLPVRFIDFHCLPAPRACPPCDASRARTRLSLTPAGALRHITPFHPAADDVNER